jgi:hypothetical protein
MAAGCGKLFLLKPALEQYNFIEGAPDMSDNDGFSFARPTAWRRGLLCLIAALALGTGLSRPVRAAALSPPPVPTSGAYLGAWVNPLGLASQGGTGELAQMPRFTGYIGRKMAILHVYISFTDAFPLTGMIGVQQYGAIPLLDWNCTSVDQINSGQDDSIITAMAQSVKSYTQPIFLRWYWEMNLNDSNNAPCLGYNNPVKYVAAWQHIWNIFQQVGTTNAAFVWCPLSRGTITPYYPGDGFVDWVCADAFDGTLSGPVTYKADFNQFYSQWASRKPMMIGVTGAPPSDQYQFIQGIQKLTPTLFPGIKAVMYFDAPGSAANYSLTGNGFAAFRALARTAYFSIH